MAKTKQITDAPKKKAPKKSAEKKSVKLPPVDVSDLQLIETKLILPDPQQPRKESSWKKNMELAESVREHGVLQPIMVRPNGFGQYIVIYGHRRLWAAEQTELTHIWCQVRERLEEHEIREIQLIENIQRTDMHPMEEAAAFLEFIDNGNSPEEICAKVGKSVYYVRQRLKLNNLVDSWVEVYKAGKVRHKDALQLATLGKEAQMDLFEDFDQDEEEFVLESWDIMRRQTNLAKAPFSLSEDYEGLPKCTQCQFNTGVNSLFPDQDLKAYCRNSKCFDLKEAYAFDKGLENIKDDPAAILLNETYYVNKEEQQAWQNAGLEVYDSKDFHEIEEPDKENYMEPTDEDETEFVLNKVEYEKDLQEYRDAIVQPGTVRDFKMNGNCKGEIVYGTLSQKSAPIGLPTSDSTASNETQAEIDRIKEKEKRQKELDAEKVWTKVQELMGKPATLNKLISNEPLTGLEVDTLKNAIQNKLSYGHQQWTKKIAGNGNTNHINPLYRALILDAFVSNYGSHLSKGSNNAVAFKYIKNILPEEVAAIELEQKEISDKRQARVNERVAALKKKLSK